MSLLEVAVAFSLFAVLVLSVTLTLAQGIRQRREGFDSYVALSSLRDTIAEIQETANMPQDLAAQVGIGAVYSKFEGRTTSLPKLELGQLGITCFADEALVPLLLGGAQDLNFDADAQDALDNSFSGTDLKAVPLTISVSYGDSIGSRTLTINRLVTKTTN